MHPIEEERNRVECLDMCNVHDITMELQTPLMLECFRLLNVGSMYVLYNNCGQQAMGAGAGVGS